MTQIILTKNVILVGMKLQPTGCRYQNHQQNSVGANKNPPSRNLGAAYVTKYLPPRYSIKCQRPEADCTYSLQRNRGFVKPQDADA